MSLCFSNCDFSLSVHTQTLQNYIIIINIHTLMVTLDEFTLSPRLLASAYLDKHTHKNTFEKHIAMHSLCFQYSLVLFNNTIVSNLLPKHVKCFLSCLGEFCVSDRIHGCSGEDHCTVLPALRAALLVAIRPDDGGISEEEEVEEARFARE